MKIVVCLDEENGMLFNGRRQSQDRALRADLLESVGDAPLWMNGYSARQFADASDRLQVDDAFLQNAGSGAWCFVEEALPPEIWPAVESVTVYRWHRRYPADVTFSFPDNAWSLQESRDFPGYSHERITKEVYAR